MYACTIDTMTKILNMQTSVQYNDILFSLKIITDRSTKRIKVRSGYSHGSRVYCRAIYLIATENDRPISDVSQTGAQLHKFKRF